MNSYPLTDKLQKVLAQHAIAVPPEEVGGLSREVEACLERFRAFSDQFLAPNVILAEQLAERCRFLLGRYERCNARQRALIVGAVRYFSLFRDAIPDGKPLVGLDDDIAITNYVLEQLNVKGMFLSVD